VKFGERGKELVMHYFHTLLTFISHHRELTYAAVFLTSLSESLAFVGLLVPGTALMFGFGAVVATGSLHLWPVLLLACSGAVLGDGASYWLGHLYQERLMGIWPFSRYPGMMKNAEAFFRRHGGKSIFFGRFVGPIRPVIPVVAGMLGMNPARFVIVNVLSAAGWAFAYILPGVFFGTSLAVAGAVSSRLAVLLGVLLAALWFIVWLSRSLARLLERKGPLWVASLKEWAAPEHPRQGLLLLLKRLVTFLFFRERGEEMFMAFLVATFCLATWGFLGVLQDVLAGDQLVAADQAVYNFFEILRTPWSDSIFAALTELGDSFVNISLSIAVLVTLVFGRAYRTAAFWILAVLGGLTGVQLLKWAIDLPRPIEIYEGISSYGFPSGHVAMSIVIYGFLIVVLSRGLPGSRQWKAVPAVVAYSFIIGVSRLYLGVHWLSDVLGGLFIGTMWVALLGIAYVKGVSETVPRRAVAITAVLVMALAGGFHIGQRHEKDLAFYAPVTSEKIMGFSEWRDDGWRDLAAWRIDLAGEREQPLTVQCAGDIDELEGFLLQKGWVRPRTVNMRNLLTMLSPDTPLGELPSLPLLHDGRAERLRLLLEDSGKQYMLRLWPSGVVLSGFDTPVFVGTVEEQRPHEIAALITAAKDIGDYDHPLDVLEQVAVGEYQVTRVIRESHTNRLSRKGSRLRWQGEVLLIWEQTIPSPPQ